MNGLHALLLAPLVAALGMLMGLAFRGVERRLCARMQGRIGPPLSQPLTDLRKLMMKEGTVPRDAVPWLFRLMPVAALSSSLALLMYIPLLGLPALLGGEGDLVLVIYLAIFPSLALVVAGFSSGSRYSVIGAQREMVLMMGYEFPLVISAVSVAWLAAVSGQPLAFSFGAISGAGLWALAGPLGIIGLLVLLAVMVFVSAGQAGVLPFDVAEAETEICGGVLCEYSGRDLALFLLAGAVKTVAMGSLIIALFAPFGISGALGLSGTGAAGADAVFYLIKLFAVLFAGSMFMRVAFARLRITQVVKAYWGYAALAALLGLLLIGVDLLVM